MMTRKAMSRQIELTKLQVALQELQKVKEQNDQLLLEVVENERIVIETLQNNQKLKTELSALHSINSALTEERDKLQIIINKYDKRCDIEFESVLHRTSILEKELCEAHLHITQLEEDAQNSVIAKTQCLFDELIPNTISDQVFAESPNTPALITIDLTSHDSACDDSASSKGKIHKFSKNKLKKYVKINKFIRKTNKVLKQQKKAVSCMKNKRKTINNLEMCTAQLHCNKLQYAADIHDLSCKLGQAERSLQYYSSLYDKSRAEIQELSLAMDAVLNSQISLETRVLAGCGCDCGLEQEISCPDSIAPSAPLLTVSASDINNKTILYCDEIGKNIGKFLNIGMERSMAFCFPNSNLHHIMKCIDNDSSLTKNTNLVICLGNRGNVKKSDLIQYVDKLCSLELANIVIFTLPYCNSLPQSENDYRYKLNQTLHTISCNNSVHVIDTNTIVSKNIILTKGKYYLSNFYKRQLALSLSYYFDITAKNLATLNASFEHCHNISSKNLDVSPSSLN